MAEISWGERLKLLPWILLDALKRFFTENKLLKLIALGIALFMWFSISTQEERDRTLENVLLNLVNRNEATVVTNVPLKVVDVRVRGPLSVITDLDPDSISVMVDASGLPPGRHVVWLSPDQVNTRANVQVLRIDPPNIPVNVEAKITNHVPITPQIKLDSLPPDSVVAEATVMPPTVEVSGPASKVRKLTELKTNPIDLATAGPQRTFTTGLVSLDPFTTVIPASVNVTVRLDHVREQRFDNLKPVLPPRTEIVGQPTVSVTLRGPQSLLDKIEPNDIIVKLDVAKLHRGEHEVSPSLELPKEDRDYIKVTSVEPARLVIRVR
jgi:YbbR domain-containing protein